MLDEYSIFCGFTSVVNLSLGGVISSCYDYLSLHIAPKELWLLTVGVDGWFSFMTCVLSYISLIPLSLASTAGSFQSELQLMNEK